MPEKDPGAQLKQAAADKLKREAAKRLWVWILGGSGATLLGWGLLIFIVLLATTALLAGIGYWAASFFGPSPPTIASEMSRPAEWMSVVTANAVQDGVPNVVALAVINAASDGEAYGDRYYCSNGQSAGEQCSVAYPPTTSHIGPHGVKLPGSKGAQTLGIGTGLMGLGSQSGLNVKGHATHSVPWNVRVGMHVLANSLLVGYWKSDLNAFHQAAQTPQKGWSPSGTYADQIKGLVQSYDAGPHFGAWALASWSHKTGQFTDPDNQPEWVFAVGTAPVGATGSHVWRAPTVIVRANPRTGKTERIVTTHNLSYTDLGEPVQVWGTTQTGQHIAFRESSATATIPTWPGAVVWGATVPLTGPNRLTMVSAQWTNGQMDTINWPETAPSESGYIEVTSNTGALKQWWAAIQIASQKTGVPGQYIGAEMIHESGGDPNAGNGGAYGLMQLESGTAQGLPGYYPGARHNAQENLVLGAELLAALHQHWGTWPLAFAAYYGGSGRVQRTGVSPGMPWSQAQGRLAVVPSASAGNSLTMAQYANGIMAEAAWVQSHAPQAG